MSDRAPLVHVRIEDSAPLIVALFNSFVVDFSARSAVGGTDLSYFIIRQLPIPSPESLHSETGWGYTYSEFILPRVLELTYTSSEMQPFAEHLGYSNPPFFWDENRRFLLKCEIDAALFHLYGMEYDEVDYIMETFPIVKRTDERRFNEYITKNMILEIFSEMASSKSNKCTYKTKIIPSYFNLI